MKFATIYVCLMMLTGCIAIEKSIPITGNGNIISQTISTGYYHEIDVGGSFQVMLVDGKVGEIVISGDENLLEYVLVEVQKECLHIRTKDNTNLKPSKGRRIEFIVPVDQISSLSVSGSGSMKKADVLTSKAFL
jgi:hypothetical protein